MELSIQERLKDLQLRQLIAAHLDEDEFCRPAICFSGVLCPSVRVDHRSPESRIWADGILKRLYTQMRFHVCIHYLLMNVVRYMMTAFKKRISPLVIWYNPYEIIKC